ncbi:MAG: TonB-dependent receptor [Steroidobacteraceae bacterium]
MAIRSVHGRRAVPRLLAISGAVAAISTIAAVSSWAQETTNAPALTEIVVTAQKREQNIQDVPISVIALSTQQLQDAGVKDIKNLQVLTPGLTVTSTTSENVTTARIRGIGTVGDNPGLESSVGVVIDGVYRPRNGVGFGDLGEIDRIEVLEGPQGELFGKNNDAGVINIVTKRPSTTFSATAEASGGNYDDQEFSASVTGPLGAISAGRLFVGYQSRNGFLNVNTGPGPSTTYNTDNRDLYTARAQYLLTPNDAVNFLLIGDYSKRNESCCGAVQTALGPFSGIVNALASMPELGGTPGQTGEALAPLSPFNRQAYLNQPLTQTIRDMGISGELNWDTGVGKLTSITAWRDNTIVAGNDIDFTSVDILYEPATEGNMTDFKQFSEELRFAGRNGPLDWLVGGFYANEQLATNLALYAGNDMDLYLSGLSSAAGGANPPNFLLTAELTGKPPGTLFQPGVTGQTDWFHQSSKSFAFFTNETYNITQALDLTAGLRFTSEKKTADSNYLDPDGGAACASLLTSPGLAAEPAMTQAFLLGYGCFYGFNPFFSGKSTSQSLTEGNVSGTVKLSYRFTDDVMAYLSWANGYKAGGFNLSRVTQATGPEGALTPNFDTEFPRETVESYELGLKSEWADRTVRLNGSIFDQQYTNFQLNTFTGIEFIVSSVRRVESKGAEFDTDWVTPLSGLNLAAGVVYAFTNITEFGNSLPLFAPNDFYATTYGRLNNRLSFAPLWSGVASATYTVPLSASLQFHAAISEKYNSSYNTGSDLDLRKLQGAYGLLNARLGLGAPDGLWTVEIWGNNLADKGFYQVAFDAPFQYDQIDAFLGDPRTFGITVRTKF